MHPDSQSQPARGEQPTGDLALLLEAEVRFAERLAAARREKERLIADADAAAKTAWVEFAASQPAELQALEDRIRADLSTGMKRSEQAAERQIAAWNAIDERRLQALAQTVIAPRILEDFEPTALTGSTGVRP